MRLRDLNSLGLVSEERLISVGIETPEQLDNVGALEAYRRLKDRYPTTTLNWLYALHCAVLDLHWEHMTAEMKQRWRLEAEQVEETG